MPRSVAPVFCLVALSVFASPSVLTAHVERMSVRELAAASPGIVVATVEGRQSRWNEPHTLILTDYTLRVDSKDAYQGNNAAWGQDGSTVTVTP